MKYVVLKKGPPFCANVVHETFVAAKSEALRLCKKEAKPFVIAMFVDEVVPGEPLVVSLLDEDEAPPGASCSQCNQTRGRDCHETWDKGGNSCSRFTPGAWASPPPRVIQ